MKKYRFLGAFLAGAMIVSGAPVISEPFTFSSYAESKLAAPTGIKATAVNSSYITLSWNDVSGASAYRVYMYDAATKSFKTYANVYSSQCKITGLKAAKTYKFRVAALKKVDGKFSAQTKSGIISVKTKLAAPQELKATLFGTNSVKLTWNDVDGAYGYQVYKYSPSKGSYLVYKNVSSTTCIVDNLTLGQSYQFKVAALAKSGNDVVAQVKSATASINLAAPKTSGPASIINFPAFGTDVSKAFKSMGITNYVDAGYIKDDVSGYGGILKVNGVEVTVLLYFTSGGKFFYGCAIIPNALMKYDDAFEKIKRTSKGVLTNVTTTDGTMSVWTDTSTKNIEFLIGSDVLPGFLYGSMSGKLTPASMKSMTGTPVNISINGMLNVLQ